MTLSVRPRPYIIPEYSLTGDLLAYLQCPLQYRYYNKAALPPSTPVQLWFGEFIHGVMEEAYETWRRDPTRQRFPWAWLPEVREIEMRVHERLLARGLYPPPQLFCPYDATRTTQGLCADANHPHQLTSSHRTANAINTWGQHLFPIIAEAEVKLKGSRDMPNYRLGTSRSNYYAVTGVVDVISSVRLTAAPAGNLILHALSNHAVVQGIVERLNSAGYDVIIDYKGMRRPSAADSTWDHHQWQITTYAWLRSHQTNAQPIAAGILFYLNELHPSQQDMQILQSEVKSRGTDVVPTGSDLRAVQSWQRRTSPPALSQTFKEARSIRIVPLDPAATDAGLRQFDQVVEQIEAAVVVETGGNAITTCWTPRPQERTCTACDFKTYCPHPFRPYPPTVP